MNNFKKMVFAFTTILLLTGCKKETEVEPRKEATIEVEKKPIEKEVKLGINTFASKVIMDNLKEEDKQNLTISDINYDEIKKGNFDIAVIPAYLAPYLYNQSDDSFKICAITLTDNLYILSDKKINNEMDYRGKNLYIPDLYGNLSKIVGKKLGALNLVMNLNIEYFNNMSDIANKMKESENFVSLISEPYYSEVLQTKDLYVSDLGDLLSIGDGEFLSEVIIANKNYIENNKNDLNKFLDEYKKASNNIKEDKKLSDELLDKYNLSEDDASNIIDKMNFTFIDGDTMKGTYSIFMDRLEDFDKDILGTQKPNGDIYYNDK